MQIEQKAKKKAVKVTRCSELESDTFDKQVAIRAQKDAIKCKVRSESKMSPCTQKRAKDSKC